MGKVKLILCDITRYMKTFKDQAFTEPLIGQIAVDYQFVTSKLADVKYIFFVYGILPEIVGKWYSKKPVAETDRTVSLPISTDENEVESDEVTQVNFGAIAISHHMAT